MSLVIKPPLEYNESEHVTQWVNLGFSVNNIKTASGASVTDGTYYIGILLEDLTFLGSYVTEVTVSTTGELRKNKQGTRFLSVYLTEAMKSKYRMIGCISLKYREIK